MAKRKSKVERQWSMCAAYCAHGVRALDCLGGCDVTVPTAAEASTVRKVTPMASPGSTMPDPKAVRAAYVAQRAAARLDGNAERMGRGCGSVAGTHEKRDARTLRLRMTDLCGVALPMTEWHADLSTGAVHANDVGGWGEPDGRVLATRMTEREVKRHAAGDGTPEERTPMAQHPLTRKAKGGKPADPVWREVTRAEREADAAARLAKLEALLRKVQRAGALR